MKLALNLLILILGFLVNDSHGLMCEKENFLGITSYQNCPGTFDDEDDKFCCGTDSNRYCCSNPLGLTDNDLEELTEKLPTILGILFAGAIALIVLCIVCCCCCPFCLLHKRRNRGIVHNPVPAAAQMQPVMASPPMQANYAPVQSGPYPQPQYPPPQGYMPQPGYGAPAGAPYPVPPQPYPPQAGGDNPPPYAEKQMAYNPNY